MKRIKYKVDNLPTQPKKWWVWKCEKFDSGPFIGFYRAWDSVKGPFDSMEEAKKALKEIKSIKGN